MFFFVSNQRLRCKARSHLALAIALATGSAVVATGFADPAHAMQRKKDKRQKEERAAYSKEFIEAYTPIDEIMKNEGGDIAAAKALVPAMKALAISADEQFAGGNIVYNIGARTQDQAYQLEGMKMMINSGKTAPAQIGQFNFIAYQLLTVAGQYAEGRTYLQNAIDANFSSANISTEQLRVNMAESFFSENRFEEGLDYLSSAIEQRKAAGMEVDEHWYRRGLTVAYNNEVTPHVYDIVTTWIVDYPSQGNWRDAINITRNLNVFEHPEMLDLLRLGFRVDAIQEKYEYIDYIEAADPRRLPKEVEEVIQHGYDTRRVSRDDIFVSDSLRTATDRIESDLADLPALESDARADDAGLRTVIAAGDTFLNYGESAKAEEFYAKAADMPEADRNLVFTRLGISQVEQGKFYEAIASFAQIQGDRAPIAQLWIAFAKQEAAANAPVPAEAEAVASTAG
ncbi:MAG TPA: hypothetical protein DCS24_02345 [Erythrobacter sp.]|nr:hypothetical protein [Erythrobacter sp.]